MMIFARVVQIAITGDWVLNVVLPLTSCNFCFQILTVYERSIEGFFIFFFWLFLLRMRGNQLINRKMSISLLLWDGRWKLHREIQRHAIVTTYKFMTNDQCEDSFVFNMFQMTYKYNSVPSKDFKSLKFP